MFKINGFLFRTAWRNVRFARVPTERIYDKNGGDRNYNDRRLRGKFFCKKKTPFVAGLGDRVKSVTAMILPVSDATGRLTTPKPLRPRVVRVPRRRDN